MKKPRTN
jgi:hypothetical protein